jgi:rRNA small subunit aminocarboxypropyltransferase
MFLFPPTLILRHRRENLKKCSLRGLESREDCHFFTYPQGALPDLSNYLLLTLNAPPLTKEDASFGLLLIDGTWRYAEKMQKQLPTIQRCRSIPSGFKTAYPRRQDPEDGLASVEALFIAYLLTGRQPRGLLEHYHWRMPFLEKNKFDNF